MSIDAPPYIGLSSYGDVGYDEWFIDLDARHVYKLTPTRRVGGWDAEWPEEYGRMADRLTEDRYRYVLFIPRQGVFVCGRDEYVRWPAKVRKAWKILDMPFDDVTFEYVRPVEDDFGRIAMLAYILRNGSPFRIMAYPRDEAKKEPNL